MTSFFFKFVFLNSLFCFFAMFEPSLGAVDNNGEAALRDKAGLRNNRTHGWQLVGGNTVFETDFNFYAVIFVHEGSVDLQKTCTGTIVSTKIIVTAANCVCNLAIADCPEYNATDIRIYAGSTIYYNVLKKTKVYYADIVQKHPNFTISNESNMYIKFHFDLAVIKISSYIEFNANINKITLANDVVTSNLHTWESSNQKCTAYGLGTSTYNRYISLEDVISLELFYADMSLVEFKACLNRWKNKGFMVTENVHVCALGMNVSVCMTDNGGGLYCEYGNEKYFVGVATLTENCGSKEVPTVFTRVDAALNFIRDFNHKYEKSSPSSGDFIHNQLVAQYYGGPLTSIFLLTFVLKSGF